MDGEPSAQTTDDPRTNLRSPISYHLVRAKANRYDSSPRDPKQGEKGKIDKFNKIRHIFLIFHQNGVGGLLDRLRILS